MSDSLIEVDSLRSRPSGGIAWLPWERATFERAARERKPLLLSIGASWCHGCAVMDRTTYAAPDIIEAVNARVVPVRVDADRRPDVNERYNLDGWPTTALLTPAGDVLTGSTYVTPDVMRRMLAEVCEAVASRYDELMARGLEAAEARRHAPAPPRYEVDHGASDWMAEHLLAQADLEYGGFGTGGKFLHLSALRFALARYEAERDERLAGLVAASLDGMLRGGIADEVDGGFFRYAAGRDWSRPHTEKMLEDQAGMVQVLLEASLVLGRDDLRDRAVDVVRYVRRTLADETRGGFFASQRADEEYYAVSGSVRQTLDPPAVDRTLFTDVNAQAAAAWLRAGELLGDVDLGRMALRSLEHVLLGTYQPGEGVAHYRGGVRGLLTDHVHAAWGLLHLHDATANPTYSMLAEELIRTAVRTMWDERHGGFLDHAPGAEDIGLLQDPVKPLVLNCLAARVLARLSVLTGQDDLRHLATAALGSQTGVYRAIGVAGAPYASAVMDVSSTSAD
jgi:uncharacterized protein YyaL (SSP411 family)